MHHFKEPKPSDLYIFEFVLIFFVWISVLEKFSFEQEVLIIKQHPIAKDFRLISSLTKFVTRSNLKSHPVNSGYHLASSNFKKLQSF